MARGAIISFLSRAGRNGRAALLLLSLSASGAAADEPSLEPFWRAQGLEGTVLVQEVGSGVARARFGEVWDGRPLSVAKLFLAAIYEQHRARLNLPAVDMDRVIARGGDDAGRQLALALRHALGSAAMLAELARFGFPPCAAARPANCTGLSPMTDDAEWANALSLGERHFHVTAEGLAGFLRMIGRRGIDGAGHRVLGLEAVRALRREMLETVASGTARSNRDRLAGVGSMGGKSGTTGIGGHAQYDGLFCGLIFDRARRARYAVIVYVRHGGYGGVVPARIAADLGRALLEREDRAHSRER